ncbi:hypothetical protein B8W69_02845 [Mycobacterium vulneris]|uniref:Uncharacterized protein n=1 Tax=Mycolicibacterium vulneris TaxID=547163 RepID=A0A1X2LDK4_9MYCO|nr:hypothetical protein [Mycolicibacterium vulneris]OSC32051.1 hypothetical protein B8W69_02845 [Mycolicibacterium vulneris]
MTEHPGALIDHKRTACLWSAGRPDYWAAVCVNASGDDVLWLISVDELDAEHPRHGNGDQPHEQLGPLPIEFVRRLTISRRTNRCGRRTQAGRPCRIRVPAEGQACEWHRTKVDG